MKIKEQLKQLRLKSAKQLSQELMKDYLHLNELRFNFEFRKSKNIKAIKEHKKSIARKWTILREKIIASEKEE